jgi:hypothetical protein
LWSPVEERRSADPICITTCRSRSSSQRRYGDQLLHAMRMRHKNGEQQKMDGEHGTTCHSLDEIDHRSRCSVAQHRAHFTGDGDVGQGKGLTPWRGQERRLCGRCVSHPPPFPPYSALYGRLHHQTNTTSPYLGPALPSSLFPLGPLPQPLSRRGVLLVEGTADAGGAGRFDELCSPPLRQRLPERGAQKPGLRQSRVPQHDCVALSIAVLALCDTCPSRACALRLREVEPGECTVQDDVRQLLGMPKPEMAAQAADTSLEKAFGMDNKSGKKMSSRSEGKTYETLEEGSGFRMSRKLVLTSALFLLAAGGVVMIYEEFGVSNNNPP